MHGGKVEYVLHDNYAEEGLNWLIQNTTSVTTIAIQFAKISESSPILYG